MTETIDTSPRAAAPDERAAVAATLAAAFLDDPVMSWCYPDPERRRSILPASFELIVDVYYPGGGVDVVGDALAGAVWSPPGAEVDEERLGVLAEMAGEDAERLGTLVEETDRRHPEEPHQYLFLLGARPDWQSRGLGSTLLRRVLERCDRDGVPAYLEASSPRNRQLYLRHGFVDREEVVLPDGPSLWCMWREPAGGRSD